MNYSRIFVFVAVLPIAFSSATAADQPKLKLSPLYLLQPTQSDVGKVKTARIGDVLVSAALAFERTAQLAESFERKIHGLEFSFVADHTLLQARPKNTKSSQMAMNGSIFCSVRIVLRDDQRRAVLPKSTKKRRKNPAIFKREIRLCFTDAQDDGTFDYAFIYGAKTEQTQIHVPVSSLSYKSSDFAPIDDAKMAMRYIPARDMAPPLIETQTNIHNGTLMAATISTMSDKGKFQLVKSRRKPSASKYPKQLDFRDMQISVLGIDEQTKELTYRIDSNFQKRKVKVEVGYHGLYGSTFFVYE